MKNLRLSSALILVALAASHCRCGDDTLNERTKPTLTPEPAEVDFGDVPVGLSATRTVILRNGGELVLEVASATTEGHVAFSAGGAPLDVAGLESGTVSVTFAPQAEGAATGTLVLVSNASNGSPTRIPLTARGVGATVCGPCNSPPPPACISPTELVVFDPVGTCANNECRYAARSITCPVQCVVDQCVPPLDAGPPPPPPDAGQPDAAIPDAGTPDAAMPDAGMPRPDGGNPFTGPCGPPVIVPYVEGGAFGGFQSVPGSGYQQTIRITFACTVSSVTVTIRDPDYPGNVMNALYQGALVDSATFVDDGTPGVMTEDTQVVSAAAIDEVLLIPDPVDYVAYSLVQYTAP